MKQIIAFMNLDAEGDEKDFWDLVLAKFEENTITISCVLLGEHEGEVVEFTCTAEEYMDQFRGFFDPDEGLYDFQRFQYNTLIKKYFE